MGSESDNHKKHKGENIIFECTTGSLDGGGGQHHRVGPGARVPQPEDWPAFTPRHNNIYLQMTETKKA